MTGINLLFIAGAYNTRLSFTSTGDQVGTHILWSTTQLPKPQRDDIWRYMASLSNQKWVTLVAGAYQPQNMYRVMYKRIKLASGTPLKLTSATNTDVTFKDYDGFVFKFPLKHIKICAL